MTTSPQYQAILATPLAGLKLGLSFAGTALISIDFLTHEHDSFAPADKAQQRAAERLQDYFVDPCQPFILPLQPLGTPFQQRVWQALRAIPVGETRSYGELAAQLQTSARAVGNACRANPIPIVVPCHRVVGANGLGGFMGRRQGAELNIKQWLLRHEQAADGG